ncbi:MAG: hypothetical protein K8U03_25260 [Planctomycetia bacterium]|nr:hypothetical protein [Planctomycetia bacterium]
MSIIDFNLLTRTPSLALQPGMLAGASREQSSREHASHDEPAGNPPPSPSDSVVDHKRAERKELNAPLSEVAQLHTESERSMSTGLSSAVARAVDGPALSNSAQNNSTQSGSAHAVGSSKSAGSEMHRVREVRRQQGISIKRASQHLEISVEEARRQEEPTADLTLAQLFAWQKLCEVPVADLLVEPDCELSPPVLQRARMVRVMKTVQAIMERTGQVSVQRLGQTLVNQLVELMPELKGVSSWHAVDRRQSCNQNARILESNYLRPAEDEPQSE